MNRRSLIGFLLCVAPRILRGQPAPTSDKRASDIIIEYLTRWTKDDCFLCREGAPQFNPLPIKLTTGPFRGWFHQRTSDDLYPIDNCASGKIWDRITQLQNNGKGDTPCAPKR